MLVVSQVLVWHTDYIVFLGFRKFVHVKFDVHEVILIVNLKVVFLQRTTHLVLQVELGQDAFDLMYIILLTVHLSLL